MTIVLVTVIEEIRPKSNKRRRRGICSLFISITSLWKILISPLPRRLTAYDISDDFFAKIFLQRQKSFRDWEKNAAAARLRLVFLCGRTFGAF